VAAVDHVYRHRLEQYLCGAGGVDIDFADGVCVCADGGLPWSKHFRKVSDSHKTPVLRMGGVRASVLFTVYTPVVFDDHGGMHDFFVYSYILPTISG